MADMVKYAVKLHVAIDSPVALKKVYFLFVRLLSHLMDKQLITFMNFKGVNVTTSAFLILALSMRRSKCTVKCVQPFLSMGPRSIMSLYMDFDIYN